MTGFRKIAEWLGVYNTIRYSRGYEWLLRYRNPAYLAHLTQDLEFYRSVLHGRQVRLIFDVGANMGDKTWAFVQIAHRVICVEPDPYCVSALSNRFARRAEVTVVAAAVGETTGEARLHRTEPGDAYNTLSDKQRTINPSRCNQWSELTVPVTTLDTLSFIHGQPDFVKVDIEGFESTAFRGLTQRVPVLCFEANLPDFADETHEIIDRFVRLNPSVRFNARHSTAYELVFRSHIIVDELHRFVATSEPQCYDLFVFNDLQP